MKQFCLVTVISVASLICSAAHAASDGDAFRTCVVREAEAALRRAVTKFGDIALYGYHKDETAEVFLICKRRPFDGTIRSDVDDAKFVSETIEKAGKKRAIESTRKSDETQRKTDMLAVPKLKAEEALEEQAAQNYLLCLDSNTRVLAVNSGEPAEVVAQAAFGSCASERQRVFEAYRGHVNSFGPDAMAAMERVFQRQMLLVVIEARASRHARPPPAKRGTPI